MFMINNCELTDDEFHALQAMVGRGLEDAQIWLDDPYCDYTEAERENLLAEMEYAEQAIDRLRDLAIPFNLDSEDN